MTAYKSTLHYLRDNKCYSLAAYRKSVTYCDVSNIEIIERSQSKVLRMIVDAPWYVPNTVIRRDLQTPTIKEEEWLASSGMLRHVAPV
jgi:hypothetical protein